MTVQRQRVVRKPFAPTISTISCQGIDSSSAITDTGPAGTDGTTFVGFLPRPFFSGTDHVGRSR